MALTQVCELQYYYTYDAVSDQLYYLYTNFGGFPFADEADFGDNMLPNMASAYIPDGGKAVITTQKDGPHTFNGSG